MIQLSRCSLYLSLILLTIEDMVNALKAAGTFRGLAE